MTYLSAIALVFLMGSFIRIRRLRVLLRLICAVPILIGLILGTVGILGLMFILADSTPRTITQLTPNVNYEVRMTGGAYTSDDTADISFVHYFSSLPLQKVFWHKSYEEHQYRWSSPGPQVSLTIDQRHAMVKMERIDGTFEQDIVDLP
jgi:membrane-bound ClpP family serine protease